VDLDLDADVVGSVFVPARSSSTPTSASTSTPVVPAGSRHSPFRLRPARPADARACAAVMRASIRALPPGVHSRAELAAWASLPPLYHRWAMGPGGEAYLVAERRGRILGYAARRGAELTAAFVRPGAQGRGVGRALVEATCAAVARDGHRSVQVLAARAAAGFYAALGFRTGARTRAPLPGGLSLTAVRMRLPLGG